MKYFVDWRVGSCNDGSCDQGLGEFDTLQEAEDFIHGLNATRLIDEPDCTIIHGTQIAHSYVDIHGNVKGN